MSARNTMKFSLNSSAPAKLNAVQRKQLAALAAMPALKIDYSDIPRQSSAVKWVRPEALVSAGNKQQITLRLDSEILDFFRDTGARYQSRINAVLREYVRAHRTVA